MRVNAKSEWGTSRSSDTHLVKCGGWNVKSAVFENKSSVEQLGAKDHCSERASASFEPRGSNTFRLNDVDELVKREPALGVNSFDHPFVNVYPNNRNSELSIVGPASEFSDCVSRVDENIVIDEGATFSTPIEGRFLSCVPFGVDVLCASGIVSHLKKVSDRCDGSEDGSCVGERAHTLDRNRDWRLSRKQSDVPGARGGVTGATRGLSRIMKRVGRAVALGYYKRKYKDYGNCRYWEDCDSGITTRLPTDYCVSRAVEVAKRKCVEASRVRSLCELQSPQVSGCDEFPEDMLLEGVRPEPQPEGMKNDKLLSVREAYSSSVLSYMAFEPKTPCAYAQYEYLSYLKETYECVLGEVRNFFERCLLMHANLDTAIKEWPGRFGVYDVDTMSFLIAPKNYTGGFEYQKFFSASCELCSVSELKGCRAAGRTFEFRGRNCVLVNDYCLHGYELELFVGLVDLFDCAWQLPSDSSIIQAGPGTGKTTFIIREHTLCTLDAPSTVILATREGCEDFRTRVAKKNNCDESSEFRKYYRTLASYLINSDCVTPTASMFVDEALMSHPGAIFFCVQLCNPKMVRLLGDTLQIPFVNRTPSFVCKYLELTQFLGISEVLDVSYRCPLDIVWRFHGNYLMNNKCYGIEKGLRSANYNTQSVVFVSIVGLQDVPITKGVKYLTFTQSEKEVLAGMGCDVSTVHEFQGKEADTIYIVRINPYPQESIFLNFNYALVALTRHKVRCKYFTKVTSDLVCEVIGVNEVIGGNVASDTEMLKLYVPPSFDNGARNVSSRLGKVGSVVCEFGEEDYSTELCSVDLCVPSLPYSSCSYRGGSLSSADLSEVHFVPSFGRYRNNPKYVTGSKGVVVKRKVLKGEKNFGHGSVKNLYIITIESSFGPDTDPSLKHINCVLRQFGVNLSGLGVGRVGVELLSLGGIELSSIITVLWKYLHAVVIAFSTRYHEELESEIFPLLNVNAIAEAPDPVPDVISYSFPSIYFCKSVVFPVTLSLCQRFIDEVFRDQAYVDQTMDAWLVHSSDLVLFSGGYQYSSVKGVYRFPYYDSMYPTLKTPMYPTRSVTSREVRIALEKRNLAVPQLSGCVDTHRTSEVMLTALIENCFDKEKLQRNTRTMLGMSGNDVHDWLRGQDTRVVDQIIPEFPLHKRAIDTYMYSIKRCPKPNLTIDAAKSYAALQTIVYHEKDINALFCTQFRKIKSRIMKSLLPHVKIFCDMSPAEFGQELTKDVGKVLAVFSGDDSFISNGDYNMEIDISKYDKSQGLLALEFDCLVLERFGMPKYLVELWYYGHVLTYVYDRSTSVKCMIPFQRKSGDASTFILNTVFLMGVISNEIPLRDLAVIDLESYVDPMKYASLYNLEVKFFTYNYPYFCSKFLLCIEGRWVFCPDPLKLLVKLGRSDLVNLDHVECYRQSFLDSVKIFRDLEVCYYVAKAVSERYNVRMDVTYLLASLPSLSTPEEFNSLYSVLAGSKIDLNRVYFAKFD